MLNFPRILTAALAMGLLSTTAEAALVVSKAASHDVDCAGGVCTATAADAVLNVGQLKSLLNSADLALVSGAAAEDIVVKRTFSWGGSHTLTLDAYRGVLFKAEVTSQGEGGVSVITNDGGSGGNLTFTPKGALSFSNTGAALSINARPYTLVDSLAALAGAVQAKPNGFFALARDVDASLDGTYKASPVTTQLDGSFDGLGHAIDNLDIAWQSRTEPRELGLFAVIGAKGTVRNLDLAALHIKLVLKQYGHHAGGVAAINHGKIRNVTVSGASIEGKAHAGGIAGSSDGDIEGSLVQGGHVALSDGDHGGGLVGENAGTIVGSGSSAAVSSGFEGTVGGLVATNADSGTILRSWSSGAVSNRGGTHGSVYSPPSGGLVAVNDGTIDRSWTTSAVDGGFGDEGEANTEYVLAGGSVKAGGPGWGTGFTEENEEAGTIATSYTHASIDCDGCKVAGFIMHDCPVGASNYWDKSVEPTQAPCAGLTGLTTAEFKSGLPADFDPAVWGHDATINDGYPYLLDNLPR